VIKQRSTDWLVVEIWIVSLNFQDDKLHIGKTIQNILAEFAVEMWSPMKQQMIITITTTLDTWSTTGLCIPRLLTIVHFLSAQVTGTPQPAAV
jgi:hypothetical protein